jgi:AraC-like DNA-binding protein
VNFKYFKDPSLFADENLIVSDGMGYECNPAFLIDRNYFNNNLIMFVLSGVLYVEQFGKKHKITKKQGILMELTQKHKYYFDRDSEASIIWFHFRGKSCQDLINELNVHKKMPLVFTAEWMEKDIYDIFNYARSQEITKEFSISSKIYSTILNVTKQSFLEIQTKNYKYSDFKNLIDNYISVNMSVKLSLDDLARHFKMSKYHFCRRFKEELGTTPFDYIKTKKIEIAKKMLIYTNDSIAEISNYLCFYDQGYFTNVFKSVVGCSPKRYRHKEIQ